MTFNWMDYVRWTHETAMRRAESGTDPREKAELLEIWALGLGGEFCEMLAEVPAHGCLLPCCATAEVRANVEEEAGDVAYYLARLYVDTGNEPKDDPSVIRAGRPLTKDLARAIGRVVECNKKALRKHGRPGLVSLTIPESEQQMVYDLAIKMDRAVCSGRRVEFGKLLDDALRSLSGWLEDREFTLEGVCAANRKKLERRRAEGTISVIGERYDQMIGPSPSAIDTPEPIKTGIPTPRRSG